MEPHRSPSVFRRLAPALALLAAAAFVVGLVAWPADARVRARRPARRVLRRRCRTCSATAGARASTRALRRVGEHLADAHGCPPPGSGSWTTPPTGRASRSGRTTSTSCTPASTRTPSSPSTTATTWIPRPVQEFVDWIVAEQRPRRGSGAADRRQERGLGRRVGDLPSRGVPMLARRPPHPGRAPGPGVRDRVDVSVRTGDGRRAVAGSVATRSRGLALAQLRPQGLRTHAAPTRRHRGRRPAHVAPPLRQRGPAGSRPRAHVPTLHARAEPEHPAPGARRAGGPTRAAPGRGRRARRRTALPRAARTSTPARSTTSACSASDPTSRAPCPRRTGSAPCPRSPSRSTRPST